MRRREFLAMAGATAVTGFSIPRATAQVANWPERPVKLIIPYAPGGGSDLIGRPWAEALSQAFGQQFVVENRGGAGGMIGTEAVAKAAPDGYTLLATPGATLTVLPHLVAALGPAPKVEPGAGANANSPGIAMTPSDSTAEQVGVPWLDPWSV